MPILVFFFQIFDQKDRTSNLNFSMLFIGCKDFGQTGFAGPGERGGSDRTTGRRCGRCELINIFLINQKKISSGVRKVTIWTN